MLRPHFFLHFCTVVSYFSNSHLPNFLPSTFLSEVTILSFPLLPFPSLPKVINFSPCQRQAFSIGPPLAYLPLFLNPRFCSFFTLIFFFFPCHLIPLDLISLVLWFCPSPFTSFQLQTFLNPQLPLRPETTFAIANILFLTFCVKSMISFRFFETSSRTSLSLSLATFFALKLSPRSCEAPPPNFIQPPFFFVKVACSFIGDDVEIVCGIRWNREMRTFEWHRCVRVLGLSKDTQAEMPPMQIYWNSTSSGRPAKSIWHGRNSRLRCLCAPKQTPNRGIERLQLDC